MSRTSIAENLITLLSLFMLSLANPKKYYQLILSQGVGAGLGSGFILVPALSLQAHHWQKRRALAMGIVLTGTAVIAFLATSSGDLTHCITRRLFCGRHNLPHHAEPALQEFRRIRMGCARSNLYDARASYYRQSLYDHSAP